MHTRNVNVKTAAQESSGRWMKKIAWIIDRAHYNVASAQEAHAHYADTFTRTDACLYFIRGALSAIFHKS
ncbi:hypothetical protein ACNJNU_26450 [Citrobacter freundii]|uniref:hypothetical protein n=2 Tax=Citrobacter TaxID=544 RepID=UPI00244120DB|nr:hypothetical protein [Citrobacter freundii]